jgi:serine/threonine-protein kinase
MGDALPDYRGLSVTEDRFLPLLAPVFAGTTRFVRPFKDSERVAGAARLREGPPFAWIQAPVRDSAGSVVAALGVAEPVGAVFASILQAARPGETGEAFAFDERGAILTAEPFGAIAPLHAAARDLEKGGVILDPYVSHRGAQVIGAWRWLPEHAMGLAIEIEAAEAYAPLRYLHIAFGTVFAALVIAVFAALASAFSVMRLRMAAPQPTGCRPGRGGMAISRHDC